MTKKYNVCITYSDGAKSLLIHRGRTKWAKKTAIKHLLDCRDLKRSWEATHAYKIVAITLDPA